MRLPFSLILFLLILYSCNQDDYTGVADSAISFDVSEWVMKGENITCLDFDPDGNVWIGSGSRLIFYDGRRTQIYDAGSEILDISASPDGRIWLGTKDRGLACFTGQKFVYYTKANSGLPRDLVQEVETTPDGSVWFSSSAHQLGGLMHFDGKKFELFTPENSLLNQNLILGLEADKDGNIFLTSEGTVTEAKVYVVDNRRNWTILGGNTEFYWIASIGVNSESEPVVATDHSLSSCMGCYSNDVFIYRGGKWDKLNSGFELSFFNRMFIDRHDFVWVQGIIEDNHTGYFVFDGRKWHRSRKGQIPEVFIHSVKADRHNNIWFCSDEGIFILNQS